MQKGLRSTKSLLAYAKKLNAVATSLPYVGGALSKAGPLYFSLVRDQFICIDDLERRGNGLEIRDVLGLISYLREQKNCKVILLLNAEELGAATEDFKLLFEKVLDTSLIFAPSPTEAASIALKGDDKVSIFLRKNCETLGISNIRVIKK